MSFTLKELAVMASMKQPPVASDDLARLHACAPALGLYIAGDAIKGDTLARQLCDSAGIDWKSLAKQEKL